MASSFGLFPDFSHGDIVMYGKELEATPNGRHAGEPISHSSEPDPGFARGIDTFSPALKANAVANTGRIWKQRPIASGY